MDRFERSRNLIPGGKSLSGGSKHSPALNVRLPESELERLDELARRRNVRRSRLAREILHDYIEQHIDELRG
ncbi:MAG TPA: ribbon-helix-helix protein, CopG family [Mycobacterium sp.]|nr:ribbon-helix-helix protein, CopG family [Mycobacterium sp.]